MSHNASIKNFSFIGIGKFVSIIVQALFYLFFAAVLEPEKYGELNVILALALTFATVSRFGLNFSLQVQQAKKNIGFSDQINTLFIILTSIAALILVPIDIFAAVLCFGASLFIMNQQNLLGLRQYKKFMINSILKSVLFFIIPILLFFVLDIPGIVLGMAIASLIGSFPFFKDLKLKPLTDIKKHFKVLSQNYIIDLLGLSILVDKLLISHLFGFFIVGIYQFNLQILMAISALPGVLGSYLISEESAGESHRKISYLVVLTSILLAIGVIFLSPFIVNQFFEKYSEGIFALQIMTLSIIPQSIWAIFSAKLFAKESIRIGYISIVNVGIILILMTILGEFYGLVGLSISVLISSIVVALMGYFFNRKLN